MAYNNNDDFHGGFDCIEDSIERNIGRIVIVFTNCGGAAGSGFTGLLASCEKDCIKLVTTLPAPPPHPFPGCNCGAGTNLCGVNDGYDNGLGGYYNGNGYNGNGYNGFGGYRRRRGCGCGRSYQPTCCNPFGSVIRIPVCQIVSIVTTEC